MTTKLNFEGLRLANSSRTLEWEGQPPGLHGMLFAALELGGETGEALNCVKKLHRALHGMRGGVSLDDSMTPIAEELADVIICADRVAATLGIDLGQAVIDKFNKTTVKNGLQTRIE